MSHFNQRIALFSTLLLSLFSMVFITGCSESRVGYQSTKHTSKARHRATMRSYTIRGKRYQPTYVSVGDTMRGKSSWYGPNFHGKRTSNGEQYNMHAMTAAHKTWPMDTMVRVEHLGSGKSIVVRINDRGPFVSGRVIDCSYAAGKRIGLDKTGVAPVRLTVLGFAGKVHRLPKSTTPKPGAEPQSLPRIRLTDFGVQVGSFRREQGAEIYRERYRGTVTSRQRVIVKRFTVDGEPLHRVWVMGFGSADEARDFINDNGISGGFLIRP